MKRRVIGYCILVALVAFFFIIDLILHIFIEILVFLGDARLLLLGSEYECIKWNIFPLKNE